MYIHIYIHVFRCKSAGPLGPPGCEAYLTKIVRLYDTVQKSSKPVFLSIRASAGAPGKDLLPPPRRVLLLWFVSQVICAFLLRNADTYPILELQRGRTEVLNKGGTDFWAPIPITRCPQPIFINYPLLFFAAVCCCRLLH